MATNTPPEPSHATHYCPKEVTDYNVVLAGVLPMSLKRWKLLKATVTNTIVAVVALAAILEGADPTVVGSLALISLATLNGVELSEWLAAKQALAEYNQRQPPGEDDRR